MAQQVTILLPHGEVEFGESRLAARPASLEGRKVGFLDNDMWRSMHILSDEMAKVLTSEYGVVEAEVIRLGPMQGGLPKEYQDRLEDFASRVDAVVSGLGN